ncbi:hypothetical protein Nepgr_005838 [Nepenthes gracilis]|uniref:Uncharacterized protein n=1 Tax=Nepenthes gracilis TaxID=150966 RepID=A0AAD3S4A0_NEPGR|nr:hypothetical protein Nepgr_005838 [Nepenthes gracilis]
MIGACFCSKEGLGTTLYIERATAKGGQLWAVGVNDLIAQLLQKTIKRSHCTSRSFHAHLHLMFNQRIPLMKA